MTSDTARRRISLRLRFRWWLDTKLDDYRDSWYRRYRGNGSGTKARWWIARQVDRLPGQCWADLADFGLGRSVVPWARMRDACREDATRCGTCYCGKVAREDVPSWPEGPKARVVVPITADSEFLPPAPESGASS